MELWNVGMGMRKKAGRMEYWNSGIGMRRFFHRLGPLFPATQALTIFLFTAYCMLPTPSDTPWPHH